MRVVHGAAKGVHLRTDRIHKFLVSFGVAASVYSMIALFKNGSVVGRKGRFECFGYIIANLVSSVPVKAFEVDGFKIEFGDNDISDLPFVVNAGVIIGKCNVFWQIKEVEIFEWFEPRIFVFV